MTHESSMPGGTAPLPGGIGISRLRVYDTLAPDGCVGGSPHVHLVCSEGYFVMKGSGAVQTLSARGYTQTSLHPGTVVWFTPGVIHRLVNFDNELEILTIMQNGGLPEAGDAVFTFPDDVLADMERYVDAATLGTVAPGEAVKKRRDLAVLGFQELRARVEVDGPAALKEFYGSAHRIVRDKLDAWRDKWERDAYAAARATGEQIDALGRGDLNYLADADVFVRSEPSEFARWGMCGTLDVYLRDQ